MKAEHSELRVWATQLASGDDRERRAAGRAILMLLDDLARMDAELEMARNDAADTRAELEVARREATAVGLGEAATADVPTTPPSWWDRLMRGTRR
jgi:hypothetical protein